MGFSFYFIIKYIYISILSTHNAKYVFVSDKFLGANKNIKDKCD